MICKYPPFVKQRVLDNLTDRAATLIKLKIKVAKKEPMDSDIKEEFIIDMQKLIGCITDNEK